MFFRATVRAALLQINFVCSLLDLFPCRLLLFLVCHGSRIILSPIESHMKYARDNTAFPVLSARSLSLIEGMRRRLEQFRAKLLEQSQKQQKDDQKHRN
jgi:hypothetical protein